MSFLNYVHCVSLPQFLPPMNQPIIGAAWPGSVAHSVEDFPSRPEALGSSPCSILMDVVEHTCNPSTRW